MLNTRTNRSALAAVGGIVSRGLVNQVAKYAVDKAADAAQGIMSNYSGMGRQAMAPSGENRTRSFVLKQPKRRNNNRRRRGRGNMGNPRSNLGNDRIRVCLSDAFELKNTAVLKHGSHLQIANVYTAGKDFRTWLPRAASMSASFRFFKVNKVTMHFRSYTPYTVGGYVCMGVDPAPDIGDPTTVADVVRHSPHVLGDLKDGHTLVWTPGNDEESLDHLTNAIATITAPASICQGSIQIVSANSVNDTTTIIGVLTYEVDIEFYGLI